MFFNVLAFRHILAQCPVRTDTLCRSAPTDSTRVPRIGEVMQVCTLCAKLVDKVTFLGLGDLANPVETQLVQFG